MSADVFSFTWLNALQTPSTFTLRINLFTRDLKLASPQVSFNCFRSKKPEKKFNFSIKTKILINFLELFDSKTPQTLLHNSIATEEKKQRKKILISQLNVKFLSISWSCLTQRSFKGYFWAPFFPKKKNVRLFLQKFWPIWLYTIPKRSPSLWHKYEVYEKFKLLN